MLGTSPGGFSLNRFPSALLLVRSRVKGCVIVHFQDVGDQPFELLAYSVEGNHENLLPASAEFSNRRFHFSVIHSGQRNFCRYMEFGKMKTWTKSHTREQIRAGMTREG